MENQSRSFNRGNTKGNRDFDGSSIQFFQTFSDENSTKRSSNREMKVKEDLISTIVRVREQNRIENDSNVIQISGNNCLKIKKSFFEEVSFKVDFVLPRNMKDCDVNSSLANKLVENVFKGNNSCLIAYGQSGTGKTHTLGLSSSRVKNGVFSFCISQLFSNMNEDEQILMSVFQIYLDEVEDLLNPNSQPLKIREDNSSNEIFLKNLLKVQVPSPEEAMECLEQCLEFRNSGAQRMNKNSSRSHLIVDLSLLSEQNCAKLTMIDLAGCERVKKSHSTGIRLEEAKFINSSLSALASTIHAISNGKDFIPFRESKLTRILQPVFNPKTAVTILATISSSKENCVETISTLKFLEKCKKMKFVEEEVSHKSFIKENSLDSISQQEISGYQLEVQSLKEALEQKSKENQMLSEKLDSLKVTNQNSQQIQYFSRNSLREEIEICDNWLQNDIWLSKVDSEFKKRNFNSKFLEKTGKYLLLHEINRELTDFDNFTKSLNHDCPSIIRLGVKWKNMVGNLKCASYLSSYKDKEIKQLKKMIALLYSHIDKKNQNINSKLHEIIGEKELYESPQVLLKEIEGIDFNEQNCFPQDLSPSLSKLRSTSFDMLSRPQHHAENLPLKPKEKMISLKEILEAKSRSRKEKNVAMALSRDFSKRNINEKENEFLQ